MKPALHVLCSSEGSREAWRSRAEFHCDLEVIPLYPVRSALETIHSIADERERPFLVCRDYLWIGLGMARQVERLLGELNHRFPNWAACGNRGVRWDGQLLDFGKMVGALALRTSLCAHPVVCLDDNLLLINPQVLRKHAGRAPAIPSLQSGVPLSLECLAGGSVMAVSPRLMALSTERPGAESVQELESDPELQRYYRAHFLNHSFKAPAGELQLSGVVDFSYASDPFTAAAQADVLELHDRALEAAPQKPSLTICCRTQFQRPEMLDRAVLSFSVCQDHTSLLGDLQIRLVTDRPAAAAAAPLHRLETVYPAAQLQCWFHTVRQERLSRIDLLMAAIERAATDYIWFVDDDDYVNPSALPALARCLVPDRPLVVIASSLRMNEQWETAPGPAAGTSPRRLAQAERSGEYSAQSLFRVLRGVNRIPICGMILPVKLLRDRLRNRAALGEYCEDYFLLLLALTAPRVEVCILDVDLATVSSRGLENTTSEPDRRIWHQSEATFLLEVLNNEEGNSPFLWQQANAEPWDWMDL